MSSHLSNCAPFPRPGPESPKTEPRCRHSSPFQVPHTRALWCDKCGAIKFDAWSEDERWKRPGKGEAAREMGTEP